jgi:alpha-tubulin suppressor-like RCC1 family protein
LRVAGLENVAAIALGSAASCALFDDAAPCCWGDNTYGVLGNGSTRSSATPVEASALGAVREIDFGEMHA